MKRLLAVPVVLVMLAGCGGGGSSPSPKAAGNGQTQTGTLSLTFGMQSGTASTRRNPKFVSPNAATALISVNNGTATSSDVSATSPLCQTVATVRSCGIPMTVPIGLVSIAVTLKSATSVTLGSGSSSVTVVAGSNFSLTVGINPIAAGGNTINYSPSPSFQLGTASTITATVVFDDPSSAAITGSGNVPNFLVPITITSSDPHVTISPTTLTTPGQTFTAHYDGSALASSLVTITAMAGTTMIASNPVIIPGLIVTRYNLAAITSPGTIDPEQIVAGPDGNIWWTERNPSPGLVGRINPSVGLTSIVHFSPSFVAGTATGLAVGGDGNLWISNGGQVIQRMNVSGVLVGAPNSVSAPGGQVGRLSADSQGNVWYLNAGAGFSQVAYVDWTNQSVHTFGSTPTANAVQEFGGLALGADNAMWFTEVGFAPSVQQIGRITTPANGVPGIYTEYPDPNSSNSVFPTAIAKGSDGKMWFSEFASTATNQFYANFTPGVTINISEFPNIINPALFANLVTIFNGADNNIWMAEGGGAVKIVPANPTQPSVEFFTDNGQTSMIDCVTGPTPDGNLWCTAIGSGPNPGFATTTDAILTWTPR